MKLPNLSGKLDITNPRDRIAQLKSRQMIASKRKQDVGSKIRSARKAAMVKHGTLAKPKV